jgi:hypothetical protein
MRQSTLLPVLILNSQAKKGSASDSGVPVHRVHFAYSLVSGPQIRKEALNLELSPGHKIPALPVYTYTIGWLESIPRRKAE